ncbi:MAG: cupin domain-containing protein [Gammaproteobacteria bacterium]|nr:cupin domain-containing protein [Gammaproteobacteria bacterium]
MITFPNSINKQDFLKSYWQKQPLLFRNAMDNAEQLITKQQLFDLSLSDDIESRLLMEEGPDEPWQVFHGPQQAEQLELLNESPNWTLLVQSVNLWHLGCKKLLEDFRFLPEWRLDDIMISFANEKGTVGPHVDHYDVFLLQLSGSRRWKVGKPDAEVELIEPDSDNQQIKAYPTIIDETLQVGDMLYIPPNTAHHGIGIEPGMTLSVGFRSPALSEMMMIFAEQVMLSKKENYYIDPLFSVRTSTTEISSSAMSKAASWFSNLEDYDALVRKSFGILQTQPKQELLLLPIEKTAKEAILSQQAINRDPAARVAWYQVDELTIWLFINGECFERSIEDKQWLEKYSIIDTLTLENTSANIQIDKFLELVQLFIDTGLFGGVDVS